MLVAIAMTAAMPSTASASWVIEGKGFGHGAGMSQYGAQGRAQNGRGFRGILRHYYSGTRIGTVRPQRLRILLATQPEVGFQRATRACGREVNPRRSFSFAGGNRIRLLGANGRVLATCGRRAQARGPGGVHIAGHGPYRGALLASAAGSSLLVVNALGIEAYVRGVVANEMPSSWHQQALRAQAVAARSYALATRRGGAFDHFADTRSQVYRGRGSETPATNRAVRRTRLMVVRHGGRVASTYYYSTSGGRTESVEHVWGGGPLPYLKSVRDAPDRTSPVHDWQLDFSQREISSRLGGLYRGRLRAIRVLRTGESPRIVRARVVGSEGSSVVSGDTLRSRLGLRSTWARFERR